MRTQFNTKAASAAAAEGAKDATVAARLATAFSLITAAAGLALFAGCSVMGTTRLTAQSCNDAYARGDYATLASGLRHFERLEEPCRRPVLVALAEEEPAKLIEVATESGDPGMVVAAALAAGVQGIEVKVARRSRRVLRRSNDGRLLLHWLASGELDAPKINAAAALTTDLVGARRKVAMLLHEGADDVVLRPALRELSMLTEAAMQSGTVFGALVPPVPVRPRTTNMQALAAKLALVPYLETPATDALAIIEVGPLPMAAGRAESPDKEPVVHAKDPILFGSRHTLTEG